MRVRISYRADRRIKVVEVKTGTKHFLVPLHDFSYETRITDFTEHLGEVSIDTDVYTKLWKGRIISAEPHSFRFRRAKEEG
jgi:hypothetical protein